MNPEGYSPNPERARVEELRANIYSETKAENVVPVRVLSGQGALVDLVLEDTIDKWERVKRPLIVIECAHPEKDVQTVIYKGKITEGPHEGLEREIEFYSKMRPFKEELSAQQIEIADVIKQRTEANPPYIILSHIDGETLGSIHTLDPERLDPERDFSKIALFIDKAKDALSEPPVSEHLQNNKVDRITSYRSTLEMLKQHPEVFSKFSEKLERVMAIAERMLANSEFKPCIRDLNPSNLMHLEDGKKLGIIDFERNCLANNDGYDYSFLYVGLWGEPDKQRILQSQLNSRNELLGDKMVLDAVLHRMPCEMLYWYKFAESNRDNEEMIALARDALTFYLAKFDEDLDQLINNEQGSI